MATEKITCRKAKLDDDFVRLAELIYLTDDSIYPMWFNSIDECKRVLPDLMKQPGFIFNYNNLYVGCDSENNIVALVCVLEKNTNLDYDYTNLCKTNENYKFVIEEYIKKIIEEVKNESSESSKYCYISNVCVYPTKRNLHVGAQIMEYVIQDLTDKKFDQIALDVLKHNPSAIRLYENNGFKKGEEYIDFDGSETIAMKR